MRLDRLAKILVSSAANCVWVGIGVAAHFARSYVRQQLDTEQGILHLLPYPPVTNC